MPLVRDFVMAAATQHVADVLDARDALAEEVAVLPDLMADVVDAVPHVVIIVAQDAPADVTLHVVDAEVLVLLDVVPHVLQLVPEPIHQHLAHLAK